MISVSWRVALIDLLLWMWVSDVGLLSWVGAVVLRSEETNPRLEILIDCASDCFGTSLWCGLGGSTWAHRCGTIPIGPIGAVSCSPRISVARCALITIPRPGCQGMHLPSLPLQIPSNRSEIDIRKRRGMPNRVGELGECVWVNPSVAIYRDRLHLPKGRYPSHVPRL